MPIPLQRSCRSWLPLLAMMLLAAECHAQYYASDTPQNSRPSERGPSSTVGMSARAPTPSGRRPQGTGATPKFGVSRRNSNDSPFPEGIRQQALGLLDRNPTRAVRERMNRANMDSQLLQLSGLDQAMSLDQPLGQTTYAINPVPSLEGYLYTPKPDWTPFQLAFGLEPSTPQEAPPAPIELSALIAQRTQRRLVDIYSNALAEFKNATLAEADETRQRGQIARATRQLSIVSETLAPRFESSRSQSADSIQLDLDLDSESAQMLRATAVLMIHGYLGQNRLLPAIESLYAAVDRSSSVFAREPVPIATYFGDYSDVSGTSTALERQMQRHLRTAEFNVELPEAYVVSAYCAMRLNDRAKALDYLSRGEQLQVRLRGSASDAYRRVAGAILAALEAKTGSSSLPD